MTSLRFIGQCIKLTAVSLVYATAQPMLLGLRAVVIAWQESRR